MLRVTLSRAEPPCIVTFEAKQVLLHDVAVPELLIQRGDIGIVHLFANKNWTITVDRVES
jgi:hypothetical protein